MNILQKAARSLLGERKIYKALYSWIAKNQVVWHPDNAETYIHKGYQMNPMLYSVVSFIAQKASAIPFYVQEIRPGKDPVRITDHPICQKLENPNPEQGYYEFMEMLYTFKLITGNHYIYAVRPFAGQDAGKLVESSELWVLPSQYMQIISGGWQEPIKGYSLMYGDESITFTPEEILHGKTVNLEYQNGTEMYGMSPVKVLVRTLTKSNSAYEAQSAQYQNGGPAGMIVNKDEVNPWTDPQLDEYYGKFNARFGGPQNKGKIQIANGDVTYISTGLSPVDLGILEDSKVTIKDFCRVYSVKPELFGDDSASTYNNKMEARKAAYTDAIIPIVESMAAELTRKFAKAYNTKGVRYEVVADYSNVEELQKDRVTQAQWLSQAYWIPTQRKQQIMGEEVDMSLPKYIMPVGLMTAEDLVYNPSNDPMITDPQKLESWGQLNLDYFTLDVVDNYPTEAKKAAAKALEYKSKKEAEGMPEAGWLMSKKIAEGRALTKSELGQIRNLLKGASSYVNGNTRGELIKPQIMFEAWGGQSMLTWLDSKD